MILYPDHARRFLGACPTRGSSPPRKDHLHSDAGEDDQKSLPASGIDKCLAHIHKEGRSQVDEVEAHRVDLSAIVLAGQPVGRLVKEREDKKQQPELSQVARSLLRKL